MSDTQRHLYGVLLERVNPTTRGRRYAQRPTACRTNRSEADIKIGHNGAASQHRVRVERGIYRQQNGKYAVCFTLNGKPCFRTVGCDLELARQQRQALVEAARWGVVAAAPRLRFRQAADWWVERFARKVAAGQRRERTLEIRRYHLERHLLPAIGGWLLREITVQDVCELLDILRGKGLSESTIAGVLATLNTIMRFAVRNGWIPDSPVEKLDSCERPRPVAHPQRALGREEVRQLLDACLPRYRVPIATALFTGLRLSELLGLIWQDIDLRGGAIHVRAQLSRARGGAPAQRVALKTRNAQRQIPLSPPLAAVLRDHRSTCDLKADGDWVFAARNGTPLAQRNVQRRALQRAADAAGLLSAGRRLRFHDQRHTFTSHLIIDLRLDVVQVSRILGHASVSTTLNVYAHLFDEARHAADIRARMSRSEFARLLAPEDDETVIVLPAPAASRRGRLSAQERAAISWSA